ncbi:MAG: hypothetical protein JO256_04645 [Alphaproteobacteria bacterium]|nr:hypothetical protein [Alphaproteobacteria bacterium]
MRVVALALLVWAGAAQAAWMPSDISAYVTRRKGCNHWSGEEPYDKARAAQISRAVTKLNCRVLDAEEKTLLHRYRHAAPQLKQIRAARGALL